MPMAPTAAARPALSQPLPMGSWGALPDQLTERERKRRLGLQVILCAVQPPREGGELQHYSPTLGRC